jgi:hypothetical protein
MPELIISPAKSSLEQEWVAPREESAAFRRSTPIGYREGLLCMLSAWLYTTPFKTQK